MHLELYPIKAHIQVEFDEVHTKSGCIVKDQCQSVKRAHSNALAVKVKRDVEKGDLLAHFTQVVSDKVL